LTRVLAKLSLLTAGVLLLANQFVPPEMHSWLSALPLALAGIAYAVLQIRLRPARGVLWKRLLLASAFVFWAVDQMLPAGRLAVFVGDAVIAAYVLDLFWMAREQETMENDARENDARQEEAERPACLTLRG
jgi:hypothetical protein